MGIQPGRDESSDKLSDALTLPKFSSTKAQRERKKKNI